VAHRPWRFFFNPAQYLDQLPDSPGGERLALVDQWLVIGEPRLGLGKFLTVAPVASIFAIRSSSTSLKAAAMSSRDNCIMALDLFPIEEAA
jgi:hypothetical protein